MLRSVIEELVDHHGELFAPDIRRMQCKARCETCPAPDTGDVLTQHVACAQGALRALDLEPDAEVARALAE